MDKDALVAHLVGPGRADEQECIKLSATKFIAKTVWNGLKLHECEFLRVYAAGTAAHKAVLIGRSAAMIQSNWTLPIRDAPVTLANPERMPPRKAQWPKGVEYRAMKIPPTDYGVVTPAGEPLRVTTRTRTAVDIARMYGVRHGAVAMDSLFYRQSFAEQDRIRTQLRACIDRLAGKRGIANARQALEWSSTRSESPYESLARVILRERGIVVQEQMWIGRYARPGLLWGQLAIEIDGEGKMEGKEAALDQISRENWIRIQRYEVARVPPRDILRDEEGVVRQILELKERSMLLDGPKVIATSYRPQHGEDWRRKKS